LKIHLLSNLYFKMKRILEFFKWIFVLLLVFVIVLYVTGYGYILKGVWVVYFQGYTTEYMDDFKFFETEEMPTITNPQHWTINKNYNTVEATKALSEINDRLGTIAFLVVKNDSIWYEKYFDGFGKNSQTNSFSMSKSITSALLGKAIDDGFIKSLD